MRCENVADRSSTLFEIKPGRQRSKEIKRNLDTQSLIVSYTSKVNNHVEVIFGYTYNWWGIDRIDI